MTDQFDIQIDIDEPFMELIDEPQLIQVAQHVLVAESVPAPATVTIWITDEDELHSLNRTYRGVDRSTDVLSFGTEEQEGFVVAPDQPRHLGDLAVSYPHVVRQAEEYGHSRQRELCYLVTHGLLHLLGYDHEQPDDAARMRSREESLLGTLGITREAADGA
jgi:probable rRNA maturation factor